MVGFKGKNFSKQIKIYRKNFKWKNMQPSRYNSEESHSKEGTSNKNIFSKYSIFIKRYMEQECLFLRVTPT